MYSQTDNKTRTFYSLKMAEGSTPQVIETTKYNYKTLEKKPEKQDIFTGFALDDRLILFRKEVGTEAFSLRSVEIK